jgi:hypothetical protein
MKIILVAASLFLSSLAGATNWSCEGYWVSSNGDSINPARQVKMQFTTENKAGAKTPMKIIIGSTVLSGVATVGPNYAFQVNDTDKNVSVEGLLKFSIAEDHNMSVLLNGQSGFAEVTGLFPTCVAQ